MKPSLCMLHLFACIANCFPVSSGGTFQRVFMISYLDEEILVSFEGWFGNMFDPCGYHKEEFGLWPEVFSHGKKTVYCS